MTAPKNKHLIFPVEVWENPNLGWPEKILYAEIATYAARGKVCFMSNKAIAEFLKCKEVTARSYLASLVKAGFLAVENFDGRVRKISCRLLPKYHAECYENSRQTATKIAHTNNNISSSDINISSEAIFKKTITKENPFNFRNSLVELGVSKDVADAWMQVRKNKRATNTKIAFDAIAKEISKTGRSADDCVRMAVVNSWCGFRASWMLNADASMHRQAPRRENYVEAGLRVADELLGTNYVEQANNLRNGK